jgi:hypothetical protein
MVLEKESAHTKKNMEKFEMKEEIETLGGQRIYSRGKCWKKGGIKALLKETSFFDCIGDTICQHIVECYRGMRKPESQGGAEMTDHEIRVWSEEQSRSLKEMIRQVMFHESCK